MRLTNSWRGFLPDKWKETRRGSTNLRAPAVLAVEHFSKIEPFLTAKSLSQTKETPMLPGVIAEKSIQEYWILDPEAGTVEVFSMKRDQYTLHGRWHPAEKARSVLLQGFEIEVADLFRDLSN